MFLNFMWLGGSYATGYTFHNIPPRGTIQTKNKLDHVAFSVNASRHSLTTATKSSANTIAYTDTKASDCKAIPINHKITTSSTINQSHVKPRPKIASQYMAAYAIHLSCWNHVPVRESGSSQSTNQAATSP